MTSSTAKMSVFAVAVMAASAKACMPPDSSRTLTPDTTTSIYPYLARLQYVTDTNGDGHHAIQYNVPSNGALTRWGYVSNLNTSNTHTIITTETWGNPALGQWRPFEVRFYCILPLPIRDVIAQLLLSMQRLQMPTEMATYILGFVQLSPHALFALPRL